MAAEQHHTPSGVILNHNVDADEAAPGAWQPIGRLAADIVEAVVRSASAGAGDK